MVAEQAWSATNPTHIDTLLARATRRNVELVRLVAARNLLQNAQASISTVARLSGFNHPENLHRTFHKHLGIRPQEYVERFA